MARAKGVIFYPEHVSVARKLLSTEEIGTLFLALVDYAKDGSIPDSSPKTWEACFELMRDAIDDNAKRYEQTCERNRMNALKRHSTELSSAGTSDCERPHATADDGLPSVAIPANRTKHNRTEQNRIKQGIDGRAKRFTPPTVDEVDAYCKERRNSVDAQKFVDFYASKGWMVGKNGMRDWKAAVRTWEKEQRQDASPSLYGGLRKIPTDEEYSAGISPSGFGWA